MPQTQETQERPSYWHIRNTMDNGMAWSNTHGWTDDEEYDLFSNFEKQHMSLPIDGYWHGVS